MSGPIALHVNFRGHGLRWPLKDDYEVEVWTTGHELLATLPGRVIRHLVEHHLAGAALQGEIVSRVRKPQAMLPAKGFGRDQRRAFRKQRRSRSAKGM